MLLFDKTMTALEAKEVGLVNEVFPASTFEEDVKSRLDDLSQYHPKGKSLLQLRITTFPPN